jgi:hypothetical protein
MDIEQDIKNAKRLYVSQLEQTSFYIKKEVSESDRLEKGEYWEPSPTLLSAMYSAIAAAHKLEALLQIKP